MNYQGCTYTVVIAPPGATRKCECSGCNWTGRFSELVEIETAYLTPGDPSPAGRCPECVSLAYVVERKVAK